MKLNVLVVALGLLLPCVTLSTGCKRHTRIVELHNGPPGQDGHDGQDGQDGTDGKDGENGKNGLDGLSFDFIRGVNNSVLVDGVFIAPADLVVPAPVLALAPPEPKSSTPEGLILTFGTAESPVRVFLVALSKGDCLVVERKVNGNWTTVAGPTLVADDMWLAVVPPLTLTLLPSSVLSQGTLVEFQGESKSLTLIKGKLQVGSDLRLRW